MSEERLVVCDERKNVFKKLIQYSAAIVSRQEKQSLYVTVEK